MSSLIGSNITPRSGPCNSRREDLAQVDRTAYPLCLRKLSQDVRLPTTCVITYKSWYYIANLGAFVLSAAYLHATNHSDILLCM